MLIVVNPDHRYDVGQIPGFVEMLDFVQRSGKVKQDRTLAADGQKYDLSDVRSGRIVGPLSIGILISALLAAPMADHMGRRPSAIIWCVTVLIRFIIQIESQRA